MWFKPTNEPTAQIESSTAITPTPSPVIQDTKRMFPKFIKLEPYTDIYYLTREEHDLLVKNIKMVQAGQSTYINRKLTYPSDDNWLYFSFLNGNASQNTEDFATQEAVCTMQMLWCGSLDLNNKESVEPMMDYCRERFNDNTVLNSDESDPDLCCINLMKKVSYQFGCIGNPFSGLQKYTTNSKLTRKMLDESQVDYSKAPNYKKGRVYFLFEGGDFDLGKLDLGTLPEELIADKRIDLDKNGSGQIDIKIKNKDAQELSPTIVTIRTKTDTATQANPYPPKKQNSRLGTITFLGNEYQVYVDENAFHGDGPALNPGDCSHSLIGNRHYFTTIENLDIEVDEWTSSSFCNGKETTKTTTPNKTQLDNIIKFIEGIKFSG